MVMELSMETSLEEDIARMNISVAETESKKYFDQQKFSAPISKWRQNAGVVRTHHEFILCPKNACGLIVGKGFKRTKEIADKVKSGCSIRFLSNEDSENLPYAFLLVEADTSEAAKEASDLLNDRIAYVMNWDGINTSDKVISPVSGFYLVLLKLRHTNCTLTSLRSKKVLQVSNQTAW